MKIKKGFILRKVSDAYVVIVTGEASKTFGSVITLNEPGALLWNKLDEGVAGKDALIDALLDEYDVTREIAAKDVDAFLAKLRGADIIED